MLVVTLIALRYRVFSRFDAETPDALPDDLIGIQERRRKAAAVAVAQPRDADVEPVTGGAVTVTS